MGDTRRLIESLKQKVVTIHQDNSNRSIIIGTGFLVKVPEDERAKVFTCYHVIAKSIDDNKNVYIKGFENDNFYETTLYKSDERKDLAILTVTPGPGNIDFSQYLEFCKETDFTWGNKVHCVHHVSGIPYNYSCGTISIPSLTDVEYKGDLGGDVDNAVDVRYVAVQGTHLYGEASGCPVVKISGKVVGMYTHAHSPLDYLTHAADCAALCE